MTQETNRGPGLIESARERYFPAGGPERIELEVFADLRARLAAFAQARGLHEADAIRLALAAGLAFLSDQQSLSAAGAMDGHGAEELEGSLARHVALEADYAVLKHRLWLALQDNQTMSLRDGALSKSVQGLQALVNKLKGDIAALQAEKAALQASQTATLFPPVPASTGQPGKLRERLRDWLRRSRERP